MEDISIEDASDLVLELSAPAPSEAFSLFKVQEDGTKKEFKLRMRLLREEEDIACLREAQEYAKKNGEVSKEYGDIYKEAQAVALIARALCRPDKRFLPAGPKGTGEGPAYYPQLFTSSAQLRASFTANEISVCLNQYEVTKAKYRCTESFSADEIDKWAERLSDAMLGPLFLGRLDSSLWPALLMSMAQRVKSLSESLGQWPPSSEPTSESEQPSSGDGTGGSTPSPHVVTSAGEALPEDKLLTKEEADAIVKARRAPQK